MDSIPPTGWKETWLLDRSFELSIAANLSASASFNAYADHMQTAEFQAALAELMVLAASSQTAILCAEVLPWRCHRQFIADALVAHGCDVRHILGARSVRPHRLTEFARVVQGQVTYPGQTNE